MINFKGLVLILLLFGLYWRVSECCRSSTQIECYVGSTETIEDSTCKGLTCYSVARFYNNIFEYKWGCLVDNSTQTDVEQCPNANYGLQPEYNANVECCCENNCNYKVYPPTPRTNPALLTTIAPTIRGTKLDQRIVIGLLTFITLIVCIPSSVIIIVILGYVTKRMIKKRKILYKKTNLEESMNYTPGSEDNSVSSGKGIPFLQQRTVARQVELKELIGKGRFGHVKRAIWRGDVVAVKIFSTLDEKSWLREIDIYTTVLFRHENILTCLASDMISKEGVTELWLITEYQKYGSLYDYLSQSNIILNTHKMKMLMISIINGLVHLHWEISGTHNKPAMAHRDIKSKNILVKSSNGTCCLADFGMAVRENNVKDLEDASANFKQGTKRYLAPEILGETIDTNNFDSYRKADIYSFGLILWEIGRLFQTKDEKYDDHEIPFQREVRVDPTFEEMREIVFKEIKRPYIPERWLYCALMSKINTLIQECWYHDMNARPTSIRVKNQLNVIFQKKVST